MQPRARKLRRRQGLLWQPTGRSEIARVLAQPLDTTRGASSIGHDATRYQKTSNPPQREAYRTSDASLTNMGVGVAVNRGWHEGILRLRQFGNTQGSRDGIKHPNCRALRRWDRSRQPVDPSLKYLGSILQKGPFRIFRGAL